MAFVREVSGIELSVLYTQDDRNLIQFRAKNIMYLYEKHGRSNYYLLMKDAYVDCGAEDVEFTEDAKHMIIKNFAYVKGTTMTLAPEGCILEQFQENFEEGQKGCRAVVVKMDDITGLEFNKYLSDIKKTVRKEREEEKELVISTEPVEIKNWYKVPREINHFAEAELSLKSNA